MIRLLIISFCCSLLLTNCISATHKPAGGDTAVSSGKADENEGDSIVFKLSGVKSEIDGIDSLTILWANGKELFKIAEGGNLGYVADTVLRKGDTSLGIITLADYFQDDQIFYVIYNPIDSVLFQSARLYLPYAGLDITQCKLLDSIALDGDSLLIRSKSMPKISLSLALDTVLCNSEGIINYYEFE